MVLTLLRREFVEAVGDRLPQVIDGSCGAPAQQRLDNTGKDLVVGSGIHFKDYGDATFKGVPGTWRLFTVKVS